MGEREVWFGMLMAEAVRIVFHVQDTRLSFTPHLRLRESFMFIWLAGWWALARSASDAKFIRPVSL